MIPFKRKVLIRAWWWDLVRVYWKHQDHKYQWMVQGLELQELGLGTWICLKLGHQMDKECSSVVDKNESPTTPWNKNKKAGISRSTKHIICFPGPRQSWSQVHLIPSATQADTSVLVYTRIPPSAQARKLRTFLPLFLFQHPSDSTHPQVLLGMLLIFGISIISLSPIILPI